MDAAWENPGLLSSQFSGAEECSRKIHLLPRVLKAEGTSPSESAAPLREWRLNFRGNLCLELQDVTSREEIRSL